MNIAIAKACGPGRPKDLEKRAAILTAAKRLFPEYGFEGTSMDAIAAAAGVSKLTVYSHFKDKDSLFVEAVRVRCVEQMPPELFEMESTGSVRQQLQSIASAFFALVISDEAISLHRLLTAGTGSSEKLAQMFWEAGPQVVQEGFARFLEREVAAGHLDVPDLQRAASQFFCLLKGELHARMLCGCCAESITPDVIDGHIDATVDMFLRAYGIR